MTMTRGRMLCANTQTVSRAARSAVAAMAIAAGFTLPAWADRTITGTYSLSSSEDWSADGVIAVAPGATLDLNGHTLTVAALTGEGVITSTVTTSPDLTGSGTAECSAGTDSVDAGATADRVFDAENRVIVKNENGYWPFSVIYDFVTATLVDSYGIKTGTNPSHFLKRSPVAWELAGSNDKISWTTLDTKSGQTNWNNGETKRFAVATPDEYRYYKLTITGSVSPNANSGNFIEFTQLMLGRTSLLGRITVSTAGIAASDLSRLTVSDGIAIQPSADFTLTSDLNMTGFTINGIIDMGGHNLTMNKFLGSGMITDTAAFTDLTGTGSGTAECSEGIDSVDSGATADRAFDSENRVIVTSNYWPFAVTYDFGTSTLVDTYSIKTSTNPTHFLKRSPAAWEFSGSNDKDTWTVLDTRSGMTSWTNGETKNFDIVAPEAYRYYRLTISKSVDPSLPTGKYIEFTQLKYGRRSKLHVNVPYGEEIVNTGVTLAGNLCLVKEGEGTLILQKASQTYVGGTVVSNGILKCGAAGTALPLGPSGRKVGVLTGGTVEFDGKLGYSTYKFVLAGGALKNSGADVYWQTGSGMIGDISLLADSEFVLDSSVFIGINANNSPTVIDLGGHTLDISMQSDVELRLYNSMIRNGTVNIGDAGTLIIGGEDIGIVATNADFSIGSGLRVAADFKVRDYETRWQGAYGAGSGTMDVYGAFKPTADSFYGCTLMDGATLDLSTRSTALNTQSATTDGLRIFAFEENATIGVKIGDRKVSSRLPVISWTSETKPQNVDTVRFTRADDRKYWLEVKDDGLYCISPGLIILIK